MTISVDNTREISSSSEERVARNSSWIDSCTRCRGNAPQGHSQEIDLVWLDHGHALEPIYSLMEIQHRLLKIATKNFQIHAYKIGVYPILPDLFDVGSGLRFEYPSRSEVREIHQKNADPSSSSCSCLARPNRRQRLGEFEFQLVDLIQS